MKKYIALAIFLYIFGPCLYIFIALFLNNKEKEYSYKEQEATEFFRIKEAWADKARKHKYEVFVISNPPNDTSLLRNVIEEYNMQIMQTDTIKKYSSYERSFFRETKCLTRNYEEGKPYPANAYCGEFFGNEPGQFYGYHSVDRLMETCYNSSSYFYMLWGPFRDFSSKRIEIENIDLFFEENRKKLKNKDL